MYDERNNLTTDQLLQMISDRADFTKNASNNKLDQDTITFAFQHDVMGGTNSVFDFTAGFRLAEQIYKNLFNDRAYYK